LDFEFSEFSTTCQQEIFLVGSANTKGGAENPGTQLDSAHQIGLEPTFHAILIVGWGCCTRGQRCASGIFHHQKLGMFYFVSLPL